MGLYLDFLIMQYKLATGTKNIDIASKEFMSNFTSWVNSRSVIGKEYICFLQSMKFNFNTLQCAEIGKGNLDSLVKNYDTTIISPYSNTFKDVNDDRIICGNIKVNNDDILLTEINETIQTELKLPTYLFHTYMTQNPYLPLNIENWENIHNFRNANIIVGVYGSTKDNDIESKINQIRKLKENINDSYLENYEVSNGNYFYVVGSMRNPVQLVKELEGSKKCKCRKLIKKKYF